MRPLLSLCVWMGVTACGVWPLWGVAANVAAPTVEVSVGAAPDALASTPLIVRDETLDIRCDGPVSRPVCAFDAVYALDNPTDDIIRLPIAFYGVATAVQRVDLGGTPLQVTQLSADDAAAQGLPPIERFTLPESRSRHDLAPSRWIMTLEVAPRAQVNLTVAGQLSPYAYNVSGHGYGLSALRTRHPMLGTKMPAERFDFHYLIGPIRTWGGPPPQVRFSLTAPSDWQVGPSLWNVTYEGSAEARRAQIEPIHINSLAGGDVFTASTEGDLTRLTATIDSAQVSNLRFEMRLPPPFFRNGGALLGIGGRVDDSGGTRGRFGYEVALGEPLFLSLNLDTDFKRELVIAPVAELASGSVFVIPSLGLGVGPTLQVLPDLAAGMRAQVTLQWPLLGFVTSFDVYPGLSTEDPLMFQCTMLAQFGL
jgi:hypothetical protein